VAGQQGMMYRLLVFRCAAIVLLVFGIGTNPATGQIFSPAANSCILTDYPVFTGRVDTIYVFCSPDEAGNPVTGSLVALPEHGTPGWDFEWSRLDTITFAWVPFLTETGQPSSTVTGLNTGGYRVRITDGGGTHRYYYAWVYVRHLAVTAGIKNLTCLQFAIEGTINSDVFRYFDPSDQSAIILPNDVDFVWSSDPPIGYLGSIPVLDPLIWPPPAVNTEFFLTVTDETGCLQQAGFFFETIFPLADFSVEYELDAQNRRSAPLDVYFTNNSENAVMYEWDFGDGSDTVSWDFLLPAMHTYRNDPEVDPGYPSEYTVTLVVASEESCRDSTKATVVVDPSVLDVPNVFTPNDDTHNDYFKIDHVSLRVLQLQVFNRNGRKVYEFSGDSGALREWQGWDGKIRSTNQYASPGVYLYVIKAFGWDGQVYNQQGMVYLLR